MNRKGKVFFNEQFAGIIEEPACISGRLISFNPQRGPDESKRKSLQILDNLTAVRFTAPEIIT